MSRSDSTELAATLPGLSCTPRQFGAAGDGQTLDTQAVQAAIDAAAEAGGGVVYVPPGRYLIGTIELRAHVTLHLEAGAVLAGSPRREDYRQSVAEGVLVFARDAERISIRGRGEIDGNGTAFWQRNEEGKWAVGEWRPHRLLRFIRCNNLLVEDVTLRNSPAWTLHPVEGCSLKR